jgi:ABC-type antimicrobial peptide transport system permease subunit
MQPGSRNRDSSVVPLVSLATFVVLSSIVGALTAVLPARRAGKLNVLAALSYE